jgi:hypothetical protein
MQRLEMSVRRDHASDYEMITERLTAQFARHIDCDSRLRSQAVTLTQLIRLWIRVVPGSAVAPSADKAGSALPWPSPK